MQRYAILSISFLLAALFLAVPGYSYDLEQIRKAVGESGADWVAGDTSMTGLTDGERRAMLGLLTRQVPRERRVQAMSFMNYSALSIPASLDWRDNNGDFVTGVRDQKLCGDCWAFASTAMLESRALISLNMPGVDLDLSEQVTLSCSGDGDCNGGFLVDDFFVNTGIPVEGCYQYIADKGYCADACLDWRQSVYRTTGYNRVVPYGVQQDLAAIKAAISSYGPVVAAMKTFEDFYSYKSGIYKHVTGKSDGDHAILLVGYDDINGCFIAKNSWGTRWGESGFCRIAYSELNSGVDLGFETLAYTGASGPAVLSSHITSPADGAVLCNSKCTVTGTADAVNGVSFVEVSTDGGGSWHTATGTASWSYDWNLPGNGSHTIRSRVTDSQNNVESPGAGVTVTVTACYDLTIDQSPGGTVTATPSGGPYISGTIVTLSALPDQCQRFTGWTGNASGALNPLSLTMDKDKTVSAVFALAHYTLTTGVNHPEMGSVDNPGGTYACGSQTQVSATPTSGYLFAGWGGGYTGTDNPHTATVDADKSIIAYFRPDSPAPFILTVTPQGVEDDVLTITGANLGPVKGSVYVSSKKAKIMSWSPAGDRVTFLSPKKLPFGTYEVATVTKDKVASNRLGYMVMQAEITGASVTEAGAGGAVALSGRHFGRKRPGVGFISQATQGYMKAKVNGYSDSSISFTVPKAAPGEYDIVIKNSQGESNHWPFTVN